MVLILKAAAVGFVFGFVTCLLRLPIPAPPSFVGVAGIIGIWAAYMVYNLIF